MNGLYLIDFPGWQTADCMTFSFVTPNKNNMLEYEECLVSSQVEGCEEERRFLWHYEQKSFEGSHLPGTKVCEEEHTVGYERTGIRSKYGNFQVNYSETKRLKP